MCDRHQFVILLKLQSIKYFIKSTNHCIWIWQPTAGLTNSKNIHAVQIGLHNTLAYTDFPRSSWLYFDFLCRVVWEVLSVGKYATRFLSGIIAFEVVITPKQNWKLHKHIGHHGDFQNKIICENFPFVGDRC